MKKFVWDVVFAVDVLLAGFCRDRLATSEYAEFNWNLLLAGGFELFDIYSALFWL